MNRVYVIARLTLRLVPGLLMAVGLTFSAGCVGLSLGGKTTYVQDPHAEGRVSALEARVTSLEHALWGSPPSPSASLIVAPPAMP